MVEPIKQKDLSYQVYQRIREMILSGEFSPGEKLLQEKIASQLGISRMPLHKAFVLLEDEFLVESIPRKGIYVRKPDLTEIIDAFECREGLEGIAARRATASFSDKEIDRLEALFTPFINVKEIDPVRYQKADQEFHESIINASGNAVLRRLNHIGSVLIRTYPRGIILPLDESMADHQKIIQAFRERDITKAEMLIRKHSYKARMLLEKELEMQKNNNQ